MPINQNLCLCNGEKILLRLTFYAVSTVSDHCDFGDDPDEYQTILCQSNYII